MAGEARTIRVLIAEDNLEVARRIVELVNEVDAVEIIGPADDGSLAWMLFEREHPEVVVLDLAMPGLDGFQLTKQIRETGHPCCIIILTNHFEPAIRDHAMALGADHFLDKSKDSDRLIDLISEQR